MKKLLLYITLSLFSVLPTGSTFADSWGDGEVSIDIFELATVPDNSVNGLDSATRQPNQIEIVWTSQTINTIGYIILYQDGATSPIAADNLTDGQAYNLSLMPGVSAIEITSNTTNSQTISGLTDITEYSFTVVPYNITGADISTINYRTSSPATISIYTLATEPVNSVASLTLDNRTSSTAEFSIPQYNFADNGGYVLYAEAGAASRDISALEDGIAVNDQAAVFGSFYDLEIDETITSFSLSGLTGGIQYTANVIHYNSNGNFATANYKISSTPVISFWTLSDPPATKAGNLSASNETESAVDLNWDNVTGADKYLVLYTKNASDLAISDVVNGNEAIAGDFPPSVGFEIVLSNSASLSGLQANSNYTYWVIPYAEGGDESTINYFTSTGPDDGIFTTACAPPLAQSSFDPISAADINPLNITLNWDNIITGADRYLVVVKQGSNVTFEPQTGISYSINSDFSAGGDLPNGSGTNKAVYDGIGNSVTVTGLDINTLYHFAVFAYNSDGNCYFEPTSPGITSATTDGVQSNNTVTFNSAATTINSISNDQSGSYVTVLDFNIVEGGLDGVNTKLEYFTFTRSASDYFETLSINWSDIIEDARLLNVSNSETQSGTINADNITVDIAGSQNDNSSEIGFIEENTSENFRLQIRLKNSVSAIIDNKNLVFDLAPGSITTESNSSKFDIASLSISSGASNNQIEVIPSTFNFIDPGTNVTLNATESFTTPPQVEVTDANENLDLDYVNGYNLSNTDGITVQNPPTNFANGILNFPANFNYQGSGNGTLSIVDGTNSIANSTSNTITVNPKISLSEIGTSYNDLFLENGGDNEVLIGFNVTALSAAEITEIVLGADQELAGKLSNIKLYSSADDVFTVTDTDLGVGSVNNNGANTTISFSSLTENISAAPAYYFIVASVSATVPASTPDLNLNLDNTGFTFSGDVLFPATTVSKTYSFQDLTPPEIVSVNASQLSISDNDTGVEAFQIIVEFNEEMLADGTADPVISFPLEDPSNSISFSATSSGWDIDGVVYSAYYTVIDAGETVQDVDVNTASAKDVSGNELVPESFPDLFSIDTENPVGTLSLNSSLVNQPNKTIQLTANFGELMDTGTQPTVTISVPGNFTVEGGSWNTNQQYIYSFTHNGNEEISNDAFITISGALDAVGNSMASTNSTLFNINTVPPKIEAITSTNPTGIYKVGDGPIEITIDFDENVVLGGVDNPQLILNSSGSAIASFSTHTNDKITFTYTILAGDNADPLEVIALDLNGSIITSAISANPVDLALQGNALSDDKAIAIDTQSPVITDITSDTPNGIYGPGEIINIKVIFDEDIQQTGTEPTLTLNTGATAEFADITNGNELNFTYTIGALGFGENTNDLAVMAISSSDNEILDIVGNISDLTLTGANNTLSGNKDIEIDTEAPVLDANPFSPANGSLNVSLAESFSITLNEDVSGAGAANIKLVDASDGTVLQTLDGSTAFANSTASTLTFSTLAGLLQDSTEYYFEFDAGAIVDEVGNPLAAFTGSSNWSFTSFGPARIDNFSVAACVGESFTIEGQYFTGVSEILTDVEGGSSFEIITFTIVDDNTITFNVPSGTVPGKITLNKINGEDGNTDNASTTSETAIKVGPSSGQIVLVNVGTDIVCDVPGSDPAPVETSIRFDIIGGSGTYEVEYTDGISNFVESHYSSGQEIFVDPPSFGANTYSIVSIVDEDSDLNSCTAADNGTDLIITEFEQSQVEAGGTFDLEEGVSIVAVCLAEESEVDLSDAGLMGTLPEINGDITTGEWTIEDGPSSGGGGFSSNFSAKTSTNLSPVYYPSLADASYGTITLRLTSDDPAAPNPCSRDFDEITLVFVNTVSVSVGPDLNTCIETDDLGNKSAIQALSATLGGGAQSLEWSRVDQFGESGSHDNTWGFAASPNEIVFSLTTTLEDPYYKASPQELANGIAEVSAIPTGGGCGGGSAQSKELIININEPPTIQRSLDPAIVCSGQEGVRYRMSRSSTQNIFEWTLTNEGTDTPGQNDKNQIDGNDNSNLLIINFREVDSETIEELIVKEINPVTGCESLADTILITIKPLPETNITYTGPNPVSKGDGRQLLSGEGGVAGNLQAGGIFSGPGVILDQDGKYFLDPSILRTTDLSDPLDVITIEFTYTDGFACSATEIIEFNVYDENSSFQNLNQQYCVTDEPSVIYVTPAIVGIDKEVISIEGPGITEIGLEDQLVGNSVQQVFKAMFDPQQAYEQNQSASDPSSITLSFSTRQTVSPFAETTPQSSQTVRVNPLPELEIEGFEDFGEGVIEVNLCSYDESFELEPIISGVTGNFNFELLNSEALPHSLLEEDDANGFVFNQGLLQEYLDRDSINKDSIKIEIQYTYTNENGCSNSKVYDFIVWKQPDKPVLVTEAIDLCIVNKKINAARVEYSGSRANEELIWLASDVFTTDIEAIIGRGESYTPTADLFETSDVRTFYVFRLNKNSSGEEDESCVSPPTAVTYRNIANPSFEWSKSTFGDEKIVFTGTTNQKQIAAVFWKITKISDGTEIAASDIVPINGIDTTVAVNFSNYGAGRYRVEFNVSSINSCSVGLIDEIVILPEAKTADRYVYNFDNSTEGWVSSGFKRSLNDSVNRSWDFAVPTGFSTFESSDPIWVTNALGSYESDIESYVYSPSMDISAIERPVVSFDLWLDMVVGDDGLVLEYSTDGRVIEDQKKVWQLLGNVSGDVTSGLEWYNETEIETFIGTTGNAIGAGWSFLNDSASVAPVNAKHTLDDVLNSKSTEVIFRFQFRSRLSGTDNQFGNPDGVAFDNFSVESLNRNVLVEYFGDDKNLSDQQEMESLSNDSTTKFSWINYRINEEDKFFIPNATDMLSRIYQYEAYDAGNSFALDGRMKSEYSFSSSAGQNELSKSLLFPSSVVLGMEVEGLSDTELGIKVNYNSSAEFPENTKLFVAVLNKELVSTGSEKVYYNVLRKLLPGVDGANISGTSSGEIETSFVARRESDNDDLLLVSFIQDIATGDIYQSAETAVIPILNYSEVTANDRFASMNTQLYPNPARGTLNVSFDNNLSEEIELKVFDLTGKVIEELKLEQGILTYELNTSNLKTGMYNLYIRNSKGEYKVMKFAVSN